MKKIRNPFLLISTVALFISCNKKEEVVAPTIANEALTTVSIILVNTQAPFDKDTATWEQLLDNNGNPLPVDVSKVNVILKANATYTAELLMLDKTQNPFFDVSNEIKNRSNYHLFFYQPLPTTNAFVIPYATGDVLPDPIPDNAQTTAPVSSNPLQLTVNITDHDSNPQTYPVGLQSQFVTGATSSGWLRLVLRHQPNVKNGTYAPGSTDLDIGFTVDIQ
ncbi:MAG: hypothetical protein JWO58_127 [Chitinophagaceae bacterium]|nr:hypothetical protein [Chitinophagaceae bacterium]